MFALTFGDTTGKKRMKEAPEPVSDLINRAGILVCLVWSPGKSDSCPFTSTNYAARFVLFKGVSVFSWLLQNPLAQRGNFMVEIRASFFTLTIIKH